MPREFQLCGLGNAIVDIFLEVSDAEFEHLGFERGTMRLVDLGEQKTLLERYQKNEPKLVSGGSVANSTIAFSQLGGDAAFIGCVGDDRYGLFYSGEFEELGIDIGNPIIVNEATGTCVCVITPDAERTMRTCLAVSSHLAAKHVDEGRIKNSDWLFIEGYVFANPETGQTAIRAAIKLAKKHGTKIAVTCSDAFIPNVFGAALHEALGSADLFFCNESEACAVTKATQLRTLSRSSNQGPLRRRHQSAHGVHPPRGVGAHVPAFKRSQGPDRRRHSQGRSHHARRRLEKRAWGAFGAQGHHPGRVAVHHGTKQYWDEYCRTRTKRARRHRSPSRRLANGRSNKFSRVKKRDHFSMISIPKLEHARRIVHIKGVRGLLT